MSIGTDLSKEFINIDDANLSPDGICDHFARLSKDFEWLSTTGRTRLLNPEPNTLEDMHDLLGRVANLYTAHPIFPVQQLLCTVFERYANDLLVTVKVLPEITLRGSTYTRSFIGDLLSFLDLFHNDLFTSRREKYIPVISDRLVEIANVLKDEAVLTNAASLHYDATDQQEETAAFIAKNRNW